MARRKSRTLTEVELEFMNVLWSGKEFTTEQVQDELGQKRRDLSDGSVRKVLSILAAKGYVTRRPDGQGFLYRAAVSQESARRSMVSDLLWRAFDGSAALLVNSLFHQREAHPSGIRQIKHLMARHDKESRK